MFKGSLRAFKGSPKSNVILCLNFKPWRYGHRRPGNHELSSCQRNALCYDIGIGQHLLNRFQHTDSMSATLHMFTHKSKVQSLTADVGLVSFESRERTIKPFA